MPMRLEYRIATAPLFEGPVFDRPDFLRPDFGHSDFFRPEIERPEIERRELERRKMSLPMGQEAEPDRAQPDHAASHRAEPDRSQPGRPDPGRPDPGRPDPGRPEPNRPPGKTSLPMRQMIMFRWFPDEGFAEKGIAPIRDDEAAAIKAFHDSIPGKNWYATSDAAVSTAWQALAGRVGASRAIALLRQDPTTTSKSVGGENWESRKGRIAALPDQVVLFAAAANGSLAEIGRGANISPKVLYTPDALGTDPDTGTDQWLHTFKAAVGMGMGMVISDSAHVNLALEADFIVAVGLRADDATDEIASLLKDGISNGTFSFVPQNTPTNNSAGAKAGSAHPHSDPLGFFADATHEEQARFDRNDVYAADLLAGALGIDSSIVRKAVFSANSDLEDAKAMLRVVGPALLDSALQSVPDLASVDESDLVEYFARAIVARGPLAAIRFGDNPYGILPVTKLSVLEGTDDEGSKPALIHNLLRDSAAAYCVAQAARADNLVPVMAPEDPAASDKLSELLKINAVSRRIDAGAVGLSSGAPIGCAYVSGGGKLPAQYLVDLKTKPIRHLADPDESDPAWPLLYRLARLSLIKNVILRFVNESRPDMQLTLKNFDFFAATDPSLDLTGLAMSRSVAAISQTQRTMRTGPGRTLSVFEQVATAFADALTRLEEIAGRPNGTAQLESLLLETVDLFQHRADAWATGLAYLRIASRRHAGVTGLSAGYFSFLGRLRPQNATGLGDGYIQAPSMGHASTAAVLRSAYLRGNGAFAVKLPSRRLRRALKILELLQRGIGMAEVLGLRGERWLHDRLQDVLIPLLRTAFPFTSGSGDIAVRLFDGLAFVKATGPLPGGPTVTAAQAGEIQLLRTTLADDLDCLADLAMCEAAYQRTIGQVGAAAAWLKVLSGGGVPGEPQFVRTQRQGQGVSHRVAMLVKQSPNLKSGSPRDVAEPALSQLTKDIMPNFSLGHAKVSVALGPAGEGKSFSFDALLQQDLLLSPLDLAVGGKGELIVRLRNFLIRRWRRDPVMQEALGFLPDRDVEAFVNNDVTVEFDLETDQANGSRLLAAAAALQSLATAGRTLEAADLHAASADETPLLEGVEIDCLKPAVAVLLGRMQTLYAMLDDVARRMKSATSSFIAQAREYGRQKAISTDAPVLAGTWQKLDTAQRTLQTALIDASWFSEPAALRDFSPANAIDDPDSTEEHLLAIARRLTDKQTALHLAIAAVSGATSATLAQTRSSVAQAVAALQETLDGDALTILPPIVNNSATKPFLDAAKSVGDALAEWRNARRAVDRMAGFVAWADKLKAHPVASANAAIASRRHFGTLVAKQDLPDWTEAFVGIVVDEWSVQCPNAKQMTGLAINHTSPQSEPPQCLLLCEPPNATTGPWNEASAADIVLETIRLMKVRAVSADDRLVPAALLPGANQVASKFEDDTYIHRIPMSTWQSIFAAAVVSGSFLAGTRDFFDSSAKLEVTGFSIIPE
jgi:hypothetical protein